MDETIPIHSELTTGRTVLDYLSLMRPDVPLREWQRLFADGRIRSLRRPVGKKTASEGLSDLTVIDGFSGVDALKSPTGSSRMRVLHEDDSIAVYEKPTGRSVIPDRSSDDSCLAELIARELESRSSKQPTDFLRPRIVHRLDRGTSGLLLTAKTLKAEQGLSRAFESAKVRKTYLAILEGVVEPARWVVDCPLRETGGGRVRAGTEGKAASTVFEVIERFAGRTLVRAMPRTGRRHQIRVHAWTSGHPVVGDTQYRGDGKPRGDAKPSADSSTRLALHAHRYELPEDWPGARAFTCLAPSDFESIVDSLREANRDA